MIPPDERRFSNGKWVTVSDVEESANAINRRLCEQVAVVRDRHAEAGITVEEAVQAVAYSACLALDTFLGSAAVDRDAYATMARKCSQRLAELARMHETGVCGCGHPQTTLRGSRGAH